MAAYKDQIQNVQMKRNQRSDHCKKCIPCIRGKAKSTSHSKFDAQAKNRVPKV